MSMPVLDRLAMATVREYLLRCEHSLRCVRRVITEHCGCTCGLSAAMNAVDLTASQIVKAGLPAWPPSQREMP